MTTLTFIKRSIPILLTYLASTHFCSVQKLVLKTFAPDEDKDTQRKIKHATKAFRGMNGECASVVPSSHR